MNKKSSQSQSQSQSQEDSSKDQTKEQSQTQNSNKAKATSDASIKNKDKDNVSEQAQNQSQHQSADTTPSQAPSFDELQISEGQYRPVAQAVGDWLDNINMDALNYLNEQAENIFYRKGVTFTVYSDAKNIERMIPFDIIPRIIAASEWKQIEVGPISIP